MSTEREAAIRRACNAAPESPGCLYPRCDCDPEKVISSAARNAAPVDQDTQGAPATLLPCIVRLEKLFARVDKIAPGRWEEDGETVNEGNGPYRYAQVMAPEPGRMDRSIVVVDTLNAWFCFTPDDRKDIADFICEVHNELPELLALAKRASVAAGEGCEPRGEPVPDPLATPNYAAEPVPNTSHEENSSLSPRIESHVPTGWRPIAEAPKDGTKILAFDGEDMCVVWWWNGDGWHEPCWRDYGDLGACGCDPWEPILWQLPKLPTAEDAQSSTERGEANTSHEEREKALEEAATIAENFGYFTPHRFAGKHIAARIRSLRSKEQP